MAQTLGDAIPLLMDQLDKLFDSAGLDEREQIVKQREGLRKLLQPLIDEHLSEADAAYKDAVSAVVEANDEIKAAIKDLDDVAKTIKTVAKAIALIAKVAKLAA